MTEGAPVYNEQLDASLELKIDGKAWQVPSRNIADFALDLKPWGFEGELSFWIRDTGKGKTTDNLAKKKAFIKADLIELAFKFQSKYQQREGIKKPAEVEVAGLVTAKSLEERFLLDPRDKATYAHRRYRVRFADPAAALWRQHWPCELYVDKTMKAVIDKQKVAGIKLKYELAALDKKHPILCLPLGREDCDASFYDFLNWYLEAEHAVLAYDYKKKQYSIASKKLDISPARTLHSHQVGADSLRIELPASPRYDSLILNGDALASKPRETVKNKQAVKGIKRDVLMRTRLKARFSERQNLEKARLVVPEPALELALSKTLMFAPYPGALVSFKKGGWHADAFQMAADYRVVEARYRAKTAHDEPWQGAADADISGFQMTAELRLEAKDEKTIPRPAFIEPRWPIEVEGLVVSDEGAKEEETFQFYQDAGIDYYKVEVPLWEKQKVIAPFFRQGMPSHFFFPLIKGERVLLLMGFKDAQVSATLEWRPEARLPQDSQGNHLLFGLTDKSKTSMRHYYEKNKPILHVKRTHDKDTEMIQLSEGSMVLQTKEE